MAQNSKPQIHWNLVHIFLIFLPYELWYLDAHICTFGWKPSIRDCSAITQPRWKSTLLERSNTQSEMKQSKWRDQTSKQPFLWHFQCNSSQILVFGLTWWLITFSRPISRKRRSSVLLRMVMYCPQGIVRLFIIWSTRSSYSRSVLLETSRFWTIQHFCSKS